MVPTNLFAKQEETQRTNIWTPSGERRVGGIGRLGLTYVMGFPGGPVVKNPPASAGDTRDMDSIPGSGRSPDQEDPRGQEMAAHSSILAWRIPWTKEPNGLQSMG